MTQIIDEKNTSRKSRKMIPNWEDFKIVEAQEKDMELVAGFVRSSSHWYQPIVDQKDMGQHAVNNDWARINFERRDFHIGISDGVPIGTVSLQYFDPYAYIGYLYLLTEHVGKGYGKKLMEFASTVARNKGMGGLALIGHPKATWAKKAYLKYGFRIVSTKKNDVLNWQNGVLKPYYEEDFELYLYDFKSSMEDGKEDS
jgi:GNAT superfamily N-acetyltransferase